MIDGAHRTARRVEPAPLAECHQERLGRQVIGNLVTEPARDVPVNHREVPVVDAGERFGLQAGPGKPRRVARVRAGCLCHRRPLAGLRARAEAGGHAVAFHDEVIYHALTPPPAGPAFPPALDVTRS